jgi:hypothetical protein
VLLSELLVLLQRKVSVLPHTSRKTPNLSLNCSCRGPAARASKFVEFQFGVVHGGAEDHPRPTLTARGAFNQVDLFGNHAESIW